MNFSTFTTTINPYMLWIKACAVLLIVCGIFGAGAYTAHRFDAKTIADMQTRAEKLRADQATEAAQALSKAVTDATTQAKTDNAAALASAVAQQQIVVKYQTITKEVHDAVIPTACSHLGSDWMRIANEAIDGVRAASTKVPAKP